VQSVVVDHQGTVDVQERSIIGSGAEVVVTGALDVEVSVDVPRVVCLGALADVLADVGEAAEVDVLDVGLPHKVEERRVRHHREVRGRAVQPHLEA